MFDHSPHQVGTRFGKTLQQRGDVARVQLQQHPHRLYCACSTNPNDDDDDDAVKVAVKSAQIIVLTAITNPFVNRTERKMLQALVEYTETSTLVDLNV